MKKALIIGSSSGIGKELAKVLATKGYLVIITGRRLALLEEIKKTNPENFIVKQQDVTNLENNILFFEWLKTEFKHIDLIIYSSGIGEANYKLNWEQENSVIQTNVVAATQIYGLAYNFFRKQGYGHLVGISSIASIRGNIFAPCYFASKAFQANYLESLYMKGKKSKSKITVTDIQPGFVDTAMALGDTFWMASVNKATNQIYTAIKKKKRKVYITKRWALVAWVLKLVPTSILYKFS